MTSKLQQVLSLAEAHVTEGSNPTDASLCLDDAKLSHGLYELFSINEDAIHSFDRALTSLSYSVGSSHPSYAKAQELGRGRHKPEWTLQ